MSLLNQHWNTPKDGITTGRAPAQIRVMNDVPLSREQYASVAHAYKLFTDALRVTLCGFLIQNRVLPDGTRLRMVSNNGMDEVMVWPAGGIQKSSMGAVFVIRAVRTEKARDYYLDEGSRGWYKGAPVTAGQLAGTVVDAIKPKLVNGAVTLSIKSENRQKKPVVIQEGGVAGYAMQGEWSASIHYSSGVTLVGNYVFIGKKMCAQISGWSEPILAVSRPSVGTLYVATKIGVLKWSLPLVGGKAAAIDEPMMIKMIAESTALPQVLTNDDYIITFLEEEPEAIQAYAVAFGSGGRFVAWQDIRSYLISGTIALNPADPSGLDYILDGKTILNLAADESTSNSLFSDLPEDEVVTWMTDVTEGNPEPVEVSGYVVGVYSGSAFSWTYPQTWTSYQNTTTTQKNTNFAILNGLGQFSLGSIAESNTGNSTSTGGFLVIESGVTWYGQSGPGVWGGLTDSVGGLSTSAYISDGSSGSGAGVVSGVSVTRSGVSRRVRESFDRFIVSPQYPFRGNPGLGISSRPPPIFSMTSEYVENYSRSDGGSIIYVNLDTGWMLLERGSLTGTKNEIYQREYAATYSLEAIKLSPGGHKNFILYRQSFYGTRFSPVGASDSILNDMFPPHQISGKVHDKQRMLHSAVSTAECLMFSMVPGIYRPDHYQPHGSPYQDREFKALALAVCDDGTVTDLYSFVNIPDQDIAYPSGQASSTAFEMIILNEKA